MKIKKKIEITYLFPGFFFSETVVKKVKNKNIPTTVPSDCYGFYFSETDCVTLGKMEFGGKTTIDDKIYLIGESFRFDKIPWFDPKTKQCNDIIIRRIRVSSPTLTGIKTRMGNWQIETDKTVVLPPHQFKYEKPKVYKNVEK